MARQAVLPRTPPPVTPSLVAVTCCMSVPPLTGLALFSLQGIFHFQLGRESPCCTHACVPTG